MKSLFSTIFFLFFLLGFTQADAQVPRAGTLKKIEGTVLRNTETVTKANVEDGVYVFPSISITAKKDSTAFMEFPDGSVFILKNGTIRFVQTDQNPYLLILESGELIGDVKEESKGLYQIKMHDSYADIVGTKFYIKESAKETIFLTAAGKATLTDKVNEFHELEAKKGVKFSAEKKPENFDANAELWAIVKAGMEFAGKELEDL